MPITKQTIAIIGSSSIIGVSVAKALSRDNYRLLLFDESSNEARNLADEITSTEEGADVEFLDCTHEACWEADVIFILKSEKNLNDLSDKIEEVSIQKIVVTLLNNESVQELEQIESRFPNSKVAGLYSSKSSPNHIHLLSRHPKALGTVSNIISSAGFQPVQKYLHTA